MTDKEFLEFIHARLIHKYGEHPQVDFLHKLRNVIERVDAIKDYPLELNNYPPNIDWREEKANER